MDWYREFYAGEGIAAQKEKIKRNCNAENSDFKRNISFSVKYPHIQQMKQPVHRRFSFYLILGFQLHAITDWNQQQGQTQQKHNKAEPGAGREEAGENAEQTAGREDAGEKAIQIGQALPEQKAAMEEPEGTEEQTAAVEGPEGAAEQTGVMEESEGTAGRPGAGAGC